MLLQSSCHMSHGSCISWHSSCHTAYTIVYYSKKQTIIYHSFNQWLLTSASLSSGEVCNGLYNIMNGSCILNKKTPEQLWAVLFHRCFNDGIPVVLLKSSAEAGSPAHLIRLWLVPEKSPDTVGEPNVLD